MAFLLHHLEERRDFPGDLEARFDVVDFLLKPQGLDQRGVVRLVVAAGDGGLRVEAFDQHAFGVEVGEPVGAGHLPAALFPEPALERAQQRRRGFGVLRALEPPESAAVEAELGRLELVDDAAHAADQAAVAPGRQQPGLGYLERRVLGAVEEVELLADQLRDVAGVAPVQPVRERHPVFQPRP